ncbi:GNAT family N-acetyltransferase [Niabella pedocola]|uniref:GNAT family N-acetyltransferase n=1 Tax=Niabella pedocola TaxID=1752077 RepID=A0ABS8PVV0_9BACT|nr:GNAT family N-acetyltransferase [Niabella pedocola]MCD2424397.1 GNAT family N-acetyltransferase [Niabella pedocola]
MREARIEDKETIIDILSEAFDANQSVNYIIPQDKSRMHRIRRLMSYSYNICKLFGEVFVTEDGKGCALVLFPDQKRFSLKGTLSDVQLALGVIGIKNVYKAMKREAVIKKHQPDSKLYYIWFIGVTPAAQGIGIGSQLLSELIQRATSLKRTICLETSTLKNIPWYEKQGFKIYKEIDFGYSLYCMKYEYH